MEVHLYRCDKCHVVICESVDRGDGFYRDQCTVCKEWSDYDKIIVTMKWNRSVSTDELVPCFTIEEIKNECNGDTNTRTDKEK
jgi:hypothetical protein